MAERYRSHPHANLMRRPGSVVFNALAPIARHGKSGSAPGRGAMQCDVPLFRARVWRPIFFRVTMRLFRGTTVIFPVRGDFS